MRLVAENLTVAYPGIVLGPLDLACDEGLVRLDGPNGSGKTSLLRALTAAIPRSGGTVLVHGSDPEMDPATRGRIGFVPAHPELPGFLTVDEGWRMMADLRKRPDWDGSELRDRFDLPGAMRMDRLSTGMRRKAEILAALAGDPEVLLFDETLANIDTAGRNVLCAWMEAHRNDRVMVLTHHGDCPIEPDVTIQL